MWDKVTYGKPTEVKKSSEKKTYTAEGSKGNKYTIVNDEGIWNCSCPAHGFGRGKDCKHIKNIKDASKRK
jgi:predicted nucleic acid-binding Zn finger protein